MKSLRSQMPLPVMMTRRQAAARAILYLGIWFLAQLVLGIALVSGSLVMAGDAGPTGPAMARLVSAIQPGSPVGAALAVAGGLAVFIAIWVVRVALDGPSPVELGLRLSATALSQLVFGLALGPTLFGFVLGLEIVVGWAVAGPAAADATALGFALVTFLAVGVAEELFIRGAILQTVERGWGTRTAVIVSSVLFGLLHGVNPGATFLAVVVVSLAGLLFALAYLATRQLVLPIALHFSWNFAEGPIFGFPVSGIPANGVLSVTQTGPWWATGGAFGPEAGAVGLMAVAIGIVAIWLWSNLPSRRLAARKASILNEEPVDL